VPAQEFETSGGTGMDPFASEENAARQAGQSRAEFVLPGASAREEHSFKPGNNRR
jgi:hypothetical protein